MSRIISSLLQRPHVDKSKRALRIPVGGHTEVTLLRGQPEIVVSIDEVAHFASEPEVVAVEEDCVVPLADEVAEIEAEVCVTPEVAAEPTLVESLTSDEVAAVEAETEVVVETIEPVLGTGSGDQIAEEPVLEKFDYDTFLSQKPGEIKAALATGDHDHHLDALTEHETAGSARKTVLGYIAGRVQV